MENVSPSISEKFVSENDGIYLKASSFLSPLVAQAK